MFIFLTGCGKENELVTEYGAQNHGKEEIIQEMLEDKYGGKFVLTSLAEEMGMQAFDENYYYATAYNTENNLHEFDVIVDSKFEILKDNYPSVIYDSSITSYVDEGMERWKNDAEISYQVIYQIDEKVWKKENEWKKYLKDSGSWISGEVQLRTEKAESAAQITYDMTVAWENAELPFIMKFYYNEKNIVIENYTDGEIENYDYILNKYTD